jgi:hypothetical protein
LILFFFSFSILMNFNLSRWNYKRTWFDFVLSNYCYNQCSSLRKYSTKTNKMMNLLRKITFYFWMTKNSLFLIIGCLEFGCCWSNFQTNSGIKTTSLWKKQISFQSTSLFFCLILYLFEKIFCFLKNMWNLISQLFVEQFRSDCNRYNIEWMYFPFNSRNLGFNLHSKHILDSNLYVLLLTLTA